MKNMPFFRIFLLVITLALPVKYIFAGVPEELHYMVSPASCQPRDDGFSASRLSLINGVWSAKNVDGPLIRAYLYCPINFYGYVGQFNTVQLWYKASANSSYSHVEATLYRRNRLSSSIENLVTLNTKQDGAPNNYGYVSKTTNDGSLNIDGPSFGYNYYLLVRLIWNASNNGGSSGAIKPAFTGFAIDIQ